MELKIQYIIDQIMLFLNMYMDLDVMIISHTVMIIAPEPLSGYKNIDGSELNTKQIRDSEWYTLTTTIP